MRSKDQNAVRVGVACSSGRPSGHTGDTPVLKNPLQHVLAANGGERGRWGGAFLPSAACSRAVRGGWWSHGLWVMGHDVNKDAKETCPSTGLT